MSKACDLFDVTHLKTQPRKERTHSENKICLRLATSLTSRTLKLEPRVHLETQSGGKREVFAVATGNKICLTLATSLMSRTLKLEPRAHLGTRSGGKREVFAVVTNAVQFVSSLNAKSTLVFFEKWSFSSKYFILGREGQKL